MGIALNYYIVGTRNWITQMDTTVLPTQLGIQQVGNDAQCFVYGKQEEYLENNRNS